jgi:hypothetical protein
MGGETRVGAFLCGYENCMLILGIILMIIGLLLGVPVLWTIGIVLALVGAVLWLARGAGASWGRRWY